MTSTEPIELSTATVKNTRKSFEDLKINANESESKIPAFLHRIKWNNWPLVLRYLVTILFGDAILLLPAMFLRYTRKIYCADEVGKQYCVSGISWSILLTSLFTAFFGSDYAIQVLPLLVSKIIHVLCGKFYFLKAKIVSECIGQVHRYVALVVTIILAIVLCDYLNMAKAGSVPNLILWCSFSGSLYLLVEKFILYRIAFGFHEKVYTKRLVSIQFYDHVMDELIKAKYNHVRLKKKHSRESTDGSGFINFVKGAYEAIDMNQILKGTTDLFQDFSNIFAHGYNSKQNLGNVRRTKKFHEALFTFLSNGGNYITEENLTTHLKSTSEAQQVLLLMDADNDGKVSLDDFINFVRVHEKEKQDVKQGLSDLSATVGKLDYFLLLVALVFEFFTCIIILGYDIQKFVVTFSSLLFVAATCLSPFKNIVDSIIFIFTYNMYNTGDKVVVDGNMLTVKHMNLSTTVFLDERRQELYIPNASLYDKFVCNLSRSYMTTTKVSLFISPNTEHDKIIGLEDAMNFFAISLHTEYGPVDFSVDEINPSYIRIGMQLKLKSFYLKVKVVEKRKEKFIYALENHLKRLDISYKNILIEAP